MEAFQNQWIMSNIRTRFSSKNDKLSFLKKVALIVDEEYQSMHACINTIFMHLKLNIIH